MLQCRQRTRPRPTHSPTMLQSHSGYCRRRYVYQLHGGLANIERGDTIDSIINTLGGFQQLSTQSSSCKDKTTPCEPYATPDATSQGVRCVGVSDVTYTLDGSAVVVAKRGTIARSAVKSPCHSYWYMLVLVLVGTFLLARDAYAACTADQKQELDTLGAPLRCQPVDCRSKYIGSGSMGASRPWYNAATRMCEPYRACTATDAHGTPVATLDRGTNTCVPLRSRQDFPAIDFSPAPPLATSTASVGAAATAHQQPGGSGGGGMIEPGAPHGTVTVAACQCNHGVLVAGCQHCQCPQPCTCNTGWSTLSPNLQANPDAWLWCTVDDTAGADSLDGEQAGTQGNMARAGIVLLVVGCALCYACHVCTGDLRSRSCCCNDIKDGGEDAPSATARMPPPPPCTQQCHGHCPGHYREHSRESQAGMGETMA